MLLGGVERTFNSCTTFKLRAALRKVRLGEKSVEYSILKTNRKTTTARNAPNTEVL